MTTHVWDKLKYIMRLYNNRGFKVTDVHADPEFDSLMESFMENQVNLHICGAKEHVPEAERGIRTTKERNRTVVHYLPYVK